MLSCISTSNTNKTQQIFELIKQDLADESFAWLLGYFRQRKLRLYFSEHSVPGINFENLFCFI